MFNVSLTLNDIGFKTLEKNIPKGIKILKRTDKNHQRV